ncbi:MAG TPA: hypothetical protein DIS90_14700 [Cytophagales bacterium]|nr:hypothetical protein [Cytophagales bacterium]HCR53532.1 hypothetical protein [Cytophagales bacterium]
MQLVINIMTVTYQIGIKILPMKPVVSKTILSLSALLAALFGGVTLFMSASVIFDLFGIRAMEGNFVWHVVIVNFICGIIYISSSFGFFEQKRWTTTLLAIATVLLLLALSGLVVHIAYQLPYEEKTVKAIVFRIFMTVLLTGISWRLISHNRQSIV